MSGAYRSRRTKQEIEHLRRAIYQIAEEDNPVTVRQLFYRLVSYGLISKSENEYKSTVVRLTGEMRLDESLPWNWIADNTRWARRPDTFGSIEDALEQTARMYRRRLWDDADEYVEVWLEKEALAGVLLDVTEDWDVPLMVTRGYPSLTYLYTSAQQFPEDRDTVIYYLGDHDPSGVDIARSTEERLEEFARPGTWIDFRRLAVLPEQIEAWDLPTRPTKRTDTRAKGWSGGSVEVDAIPPVALRRLTYSAIQSHIDLDRLRGLMVAEKSERSILEAMANLDWRSE